jgi:beta-galactosidase
MGAAVPERVWERRLEVLKTMGCNAIRTSHNPPAPEFLDLCDRMGFCVMNEVFDEWKAGKPQVRGNGYSLYYDEWHQRDVTDFVRRDRNHPSVALWSCGNEIGDQLTPNGIALLRDLLNIFHREDPTRLVTVGCDQIAADPRPAPVEFLSLLDVVGYNYADRWRVRKELYYSVDKAVHPNWRMIGTESSGMGGIRGDYRATFPVPAAQAPPASLRNRGGRGLDTQQLWRFVRTHDYVAGDFMWTGIDYLGESSWPSHGSSAGCIDSCGFPKDGYYFYQSQWTEKPVLHLFPHWNWKEREGQFLSITCFTNCDSVELFLNGKPVGVKGYAFSMRSHASACRAATGRPARKPAQPRAPPTTCTWPGTCRTSLAL